jgi:hypothetical protein
LIYFAQLPTGSVKIGKAEDVERRIDQLEVEYKGPVAILKTMPGGFKEERKTHQRFAHLRFEGTEQFRPGPDLMAFIERPLLVGVNLDTVAKSEKLQAVRFHVPEDAYWALRKMAAEHKTNMAMMARQIVTEHLTKGPKPKGATK